VRSTLTYYDLLGVEPDASRAELRTAYQLRAQLLHPDQHVGAPAERVRAANRAMSQLNDAWSVLKDPEQRRRYDLWLRNGGGEDEARQEPAPPPPPKADPPPRPDPPPSPWNVEPEYHPVLDHVRYYALAILIALTVVILIKTYGN
jgi:curved DNA-binding protein CbpA